MPNLLIAGKLHPSGLALLRARDDVELAYLENDAATTMIDHLPAAEGVLLRTQPFGARELAIAKNLRVASRLGVGYDAVDVEALSARKIPLTIIGDANAVSVAEHAMALLMACAKRVKAFDGSVREGPWTMRESLASVEIANTTLMVFGYGRIGQRVTAMACAFGMRVLVYDPYRSSWPKLPDGAKRCEGMEAGLAEANFVTIHAPKLSETPLIGKAEIEQMPHGSVIINTARGGMVDEEALAAALNSGHLGGAGLDVFAVEPPHANNPLFSCPNVHLTPHNASLTAACGERMACRAVQNLLDFFDGTLSKAYVVNSKILAV